MRKNVPDRIKLILQFVVFSLALWLPSLFVLILIRDKFANGYHPSAFSMNMGAFALATFSQLLRLLYHWRKILHQEKVGDVPDTQLLQNLDEFQIVLILPAVLLLPLGSVLFCVVSKPWGIACFVSVGVLWFVDRAYFNKKKKHLIQKGSECQPQP